MKTFTQHEDEMYVGSCLYMPLNATLRAIKHHTGADMDRMQAQVDELIINAAYLDKTDNEALMEVTLFGEDLCCTMALEEMGYLVATHTPSNL